MSYIAHGRRAFAKGAVCLKTSCAVAFLCLLLPGVHLQLPPSVSPDKGGEGIQAALDSAGPGGAVILGAGTYMVHTPVTLRCANQTLSGMGSRTILRLADEANCPVVVLGSFTDNKNHPLTGLHLEGLVIDGNRLHQKKEIWKSLPDGAGVYNNGIDVWGTDRTTVENVTCAHCRSGGLVSTAGARRMNVRNFNAFDNQFDGLACYFTEDSSFTHLNLHDNLAAAISLDLNFNHNVIQDAVLADNDLGIFMRQSCDNIFNGVAIDHSRHHGVFMAETAVQSGSAWKLQPGSECIGNTFTNIEISHSGGKAFIINDAGCVQNKILDAQFRDNAQGGLFQAAANLVTFRQTATGGAKVRTAHPAL
ncbi:MAG TPA: right-handed parallel beta-helix repeat-containing protein [Verrucomicrobiae bacterium]|jgi:hypothetical protein